MKMALLSREDLLGRLAKVKLVISDVDGTLARGITFDHEGRETKTFCEKDAPKIAALAKVGIPFVLISGRGSPAIIERARQLGVKFCCRSELNGKKADPLCVLEELYGVTRQEILYIGDDWSDLWWMGQVLVAAVPADAEDECIARAHYVTKRLGGEGAVAEIVIWLLIAKGLLPGIVRDFADRVPGQ